MPKNPKPPTCRVDQGFIFKTTRCRKGQLGFVSKKEFQKHQDAKISTHQWVFNGTLRKTGTEKQLVMQKCSVCRLRRTIDPETGRKI